MLKRSLIAATIAAALAAPALAQQADLTTGQVAVLVAVPIPPGAPRAAVLREMETSISTYQALPGLIRKYYTLSDDNRFGGIYLWQSRAAAQAFYNDAWHARVAARGAPASVTYYDVPFAIEGRRPQTASR